MHVGGREPPELEALRLIEFFGPQAVLGDRTLGVGEMRSLLAAQSVTRLYADWSRADPRLMWEFDHPEFAAMLDALDADRPTEDDNADT